MTTKAIKSISDRAAIAPIESDELHQPEIDAYIARNRDALNESIEISRKEIARGVHSKRTIDDIIAAGMKRHSANG